MKDFFPYFTGSGKYSVELDAQEGGFDLINARYHSDMQCATPVSRTAVRSSFFLGSSKNLIILYLI